MNDNLKIIPPDDEKPYDYKRYGTGPSESDPRMLIVYCFIAVGIFFGGIILFLALT